MLMIDLHLFALNCNESFRIVVDEKEVFTTNYSSIFYKQ